MLGFSSLAFALLGLTTISAAPDQGLVPPTAGEAAPPSGSPTDGPPIQRPAGLEARDPAPVEPAPVEPAPVESAPVEPAPIEPAPARPLATPEPDPPAPSDEAATGIIEGRILELPVAGGTGGPGRGTPVQLVCTCLAEPRLEITDTDGHFRFGNLPPGSYTIIADRGGGPVERGVGLPQGAMVRLDIEVAPATPTVVVRDQQRRLSAARTMVGGGSVAVIASTLLAIGAIVEARKPDCKFGLDDCADAPRRPVMIGLGVTAGLLAAGGTALIVTGARRIKRIRGALVIDGQFAGLTMSGRF